MSLAAFQQAQADLIASPEDCRSILANEEALFGQYDLADRERRRLREMVRQRGMAVNCSIYRANRFGPLHGVLPLTCGLLGDRLRPMVDRYWQIAPLDLQSLPEARRFAGYLRAELGAGLLVCDGLESVLAFDLAVAELRFAPRRQLLAAVQPLETDLRRARLHPLVRVVSFPFPALPFLQTLAAGQSSIPEGAAQGLLVDGRADELILQPLPPGITQALDALQRGENDWASSSKKRDLAAHGLVVHSKERLSDEKGDENDYPIPNIP